MQLGIIGLGRMGGNIARRLMRNGHEVVAHDRDAAIAQSLVADGATHVDSLVELVQQLEAPRAVWVMLPAGEITEQTIATLAELMEAGDTIIDGGNTFYKDDIRRATALKLKGLNYVDVGTSGGVWGLERGYCMMIGAEKAVFEHLEPLFDTLAPGYGDLERTKGRNAPDERAERGYIHAGPVGAGHYVKMVHNGIEYGLMQAYAEGFELMQSKGSDALPEDQRFDLNLADIAEVWRRGSVVSSWLLDLTAQALAGDERLDHYSGAVSDSGEGRWTVDAAVEQGVAVPVLANALFSRFSSRKENTYANRLLSAMRFGFGGHVEPPRKD
ncbi:MAG: 6-phosphogluconate dehydrogenase (decarboxylating) [Cobetia sp.]|jgi:6-phosphogluconate dehydrogenase|uniref:Decarboxylating 6-phosphogluconate dehydrogenase n=3 Tax=Cobetia TaxID=204286 RepID=A0ABT6UNX7_9GAMM|nr:MULTISPECIES: decarboxylating 6-phosphogluconate dehydrogenase [Cobetia]AVV33850.1 6-phosphogluconate dehydrogenase (decarboxylating) [Halomonas sp. SF2003]MBR9754885.1 decarboxylating 6-phosphogluconate dehydrogenase [Gammaproteobacteria bacterium]KGA01622.1 6-phosphogluconate dehydrogenase [Cobetia amphilecti]KPM81469.1 6-phosphogluconate dehydrogenase [Cobetia sp. UCD-24C]MBF09640.1 6-phosphogluconate dehydrogenase (decarboxylating) [Cobetia sp.]|tara:strand:+ start:12166 stop:13149 length:984 start_codon:yes stop_codon:yes gene_type:complete